MDHVAEAGVCDDVSVGESADVPDGTPRESGLQRLCEAVLELLRRESPERQLISQVLSSLEPAITQGIRETATQLRTELNAWTSAADQLRRLAASPLIPFGEDASLLLDKLVRKHAQAVRVATALECLDNSPPTASRSHPCAALAAPQAGLIPPEPVAASPVCTDSAESDRQRAQSQIAPTTTAGPDHEKAAALYEKASQCRKRKEFAAANDLYTEVLRVDRRCRLAYLHRGRVRSLLGRNEPAAADLTFALQLGEGDPLAYWWRGDANLMCDRAGEAIDDYTRALNLRSDLFVARYNRAVAYRQSGNLDRSLTELDQLALLKPDHGPIYLNRGLVYLARGNAARAAAEFRVALRRRADAMEATRLLAQAEAQLDEERIRPTTETTCEVRAPSSPSPEPAVDGPDPANSISKSLKPATATSPAPRTAAARAAIAQANAVGPPAIESATASDCSLPFRCPQCGNTSTVRWDKLQIGKVLTCPRCRTTFTTKLDGHLAEVSKGKDGRWIDEEIREARRHRARSRRRRLVVGLAASFLLISLAFSSTAIVRNGSPPEESELPLELEPRAELFATAWLSGDLRTMKRLTDPVQDRLLFLWHRENPRPARYVSQPTGQDRKVEVEVLSSQYPLTAVRVRIDGASSGDGSPAVLLPLTFEERGHTWLFKPAPNFKPQ